jgi:hypothetical protein
MSSTRFPLRDVPGHGEIFRALQQGCGDASGLKTTSGDGLSDELIARGYLQAPFSPALVADIQEVLEAVDHRPGGPDLQPYSLEFFWDDAARFLSSNIDSSIRVDCVSAPPPWEERTVPDTLTRGEPSQCTDGQYARCRRG